jgi:nicotinate-nucleotide adenylyltransferase
VRTGLLGGTFNPPHLGHLVCAQEAYLQLELDNVLLIPARIPPHKPVHAEPGIEHRLELCRLAIQGDERFAVSDLEARRSGPSYTVDTLEELHSQMPDNELFLIVGADIAVGFLGWRAPDRVLSLSTLAVAERGAISHAQVEDVLDRLPDGGRACFFDMPEVGVSSTMLRERVRAGESTRYLMPDAVRTYIDQHGLYRGSPN